MNKDFEIWHFIAERLGRGETVMLLVVGESSGSSPGRAGYKMAVARDGSMCGSIGGGMMEVSLVEQVKSGETISEVREQVHRKNDSNSSGMICSGRQTVLFKRLSGDNLAPVKTALETIRSGRSSVLTISKDEFRVDPAQVDTFHTSFERHGENEFVYKEVLGEKYKLYIVGGGHCALALSEVMSTMDFYIHILDDRPELNTLEKNDHTEAVTILDSYESIGEHVPSGDDVYVVVMTLGYDSDSAATRKLIDKDLRYLGVLGSRAKIVTMRKEFAADGISSGKLERIHWPIGIPINSRTPEEIAVSIAAEIIAVKNG